MTATPPATESFGALWARIHAVVAGITALILLARNLPPFLGRASVEGYGAALPGFVVEYTITLVVLVLLNAISVSLPLAGIVHYVRFLRAKGE